MESYKFKFDPFFATEPKYSKKKNPRATWVTPDNLVSLTENICDFEPLPEAFKWTNKDVLKWIEKLGYPQYKNTFRENIIIGRRLMMVDANALCRMNITDFAHIKKITESIRQIFKIEYSEFKRSISLPPNKPDTHFKQYRVTDGPKYEIPRRSDVLRKFKILSEKRYAKDHWTLLYEWLQHTPDFQSVRIGNVPRSNLYFVKYHKSKPVEVESGICCECVPPCECGWEDHYYRDAWRFSCLK